MAKDEKKEKKIIVDEDWKAQAQKEKDVLAAQEKAEHEKTEHEKADQEKQRPPLPPADFAGLVNTFTTQAFFALGVLRTKEDKDIPADLELAKYNIDMLEVLGDKTSGNISDDEKNMLENTLHQLRMAFVQLSQKQGAP
ncbi:MAG: DUF1844 domain-containing protein [Planctomycetota bacterium]|jgi:hypothetical protein